MATRSRIEYGDWQTPDDLARDVVAHVARWSKTPVRTIVEPTCGKGAFAFAARSEWPDATIAGYEINPEYAAAAALRLGKNRATIHTADFFSVDWRREIDSMPGPILVIGNPPWVTTAGLGVIGAHNAPRKQNFKGLTGLDAMTGKGNFDVSEWMMLHLLEALAERDATMAMLCKSAVARRIVEFCASRHWPVFPGGVFRIDASRHFRAAVDAVLFICQTGRDLPAHSATWPIYSSLDSQQPESHFGIVDGDLVADIDAYRRSAWVVGSSDPEWRSGIKHDCADVMELQSERDGWVNAFGEKVDIEEGYRFPLLKGSDIGHGRVIPTRSVIVPQHKLRQETSSLEHEAPKLWAYLSRHRQSLDGRKSAIYRRQPSFAIFGVGEYSFAPWKVAISGLHKRIGFCVVGPHHDKPVMFDDTCYFLPFQTKYEAEAALRSLESDVANDYFRSRIFWDAKRPISKSILQGLDLGRLMGWME